MMTSTMVPPVNGRTTRHAQLDRERPLPDVQGFRDRRQLAIQRVGVRGVAFPITYRRADGVFQSTVASVDMFVSLPHDRRGAHLSRFPQILNENEAGIALDSTAAICQRIRERLDAEESHIQIGFVYFIEKTAPVTGLRGLMDYQVTVRCTSTNDVDDLTLEVKVPTTSLCPCSKQISRYGAHSQRCLIDAEVRSDDNLRIEDLIGLLENSASGQLYSVIKRPDEKRVTELAYENPKFVEDIVRDAAIALEDDPRIHWFSVQCENFESIHNHSAFARIAGD